MCINMNLTPENTTRKIDSIGRISFPKGIRDRFEIAGGEDFEWYIGISEQGDEYVIMRRIAKSVDPKYRVAVEVLKELNCKIPEELQEYINDNK